MAEATTMDRPGDDWTWVQYYWTPIKMVQIYHPKVSAIIGGIWISQKQGCGISTPQEYAKQLEVGLLLIAMI